VPVPEVTGTTAEDFLADDHAERDAQGCLPQGRRRPHAEDIGLLTLDVGRPHIDDAGQAEARTDRGGRNAMLPGARLRDNARLAHAHRKQDLAEAVIDLVRAGMVQLFALEENLRAAIAALFLRLLAEILREALGVVERARTAHIVALQLVDFGLECRIVLCLPVGLVEIQHERHQRFGDEASAENTETASLVRTAAQ